MRRLIALAAMSLAGVLTGPPIAATVVEIEVRLDRPVGPHRIEAARRQGIADALATMAPADVAALRPLRPGAAVAGESAEDRAMRSVVVVQDAPDRLRIEVSSGQMLAAHAIARSVRDRLDAGGPSRFRLAHRTEGQWGLGIAYMTLAGSLAALLLRAIAAIRQRLGRRTSR
ncbi:hypothetical protein [Acuticoccus sediminis]|uniref:hypothetical protein n=1 Tax=Acuticoccus sediminis TaxID=2184697 RepID=UPI001CFE22BB|nr:hypothetical protein [Acuticoccus sediminis]